MMKNIKDYTGKSVFNTGAISNYASIIAYVNGYDKKYLTTVEGSTLTIKVSKGITIDDPEFFKTLNKFGIDNFVFDINTIYNQGSVNIKCPVPDGIRIEAESIFPIQQVLQSKCSIVCDTLNVEELEGPVKADIKCKKMFIHDISKYVKFNNLKCPSIDVMFHINKNINDFSLGELLEFSSKCKVNTIYAGFFYKFFRYIYCLKKCILAQKSQPYKDDKWYRWTIKL